MVADRGFRSFADQTLVMSRSVSVVVTAHDPVYLEETLRSIAGQDVPGLDIVVVDDGSEPRLQIPQDIAVPVVVICNDTPLERAEARNAGLRMARGEWVMVIDHDDLLAQGALSQMLAVAEESGCGVVFGRSFPVPADSCAPFVPRQARRRSIRPVRWWQVLCSSDHFGMALVRTEVARRVGFAAEFVPADDYLYVVGLAADTSAVRVDYVVGGWRQHPGQTSARAGDDIASAAARVRRHVIEMYAPKGMVLRRVGAYTALRSDAYAARKDGDARAFRRAIGHAAVLWPPSLCSVSGMRELGAVVKGLRPVSLRRTRNS